MLKISRVTYTPQHHRFAHCKGFLIFMCIILTHLSLFPLGNRFAKIAQSNTAKANRLTVFPLTSDVTHPCQCCF
ncbi:hypothetical protein QL093DRAFT_2204161 [Fusarium oxysporum]|nr:hypothetical protein QL093DRAFT_2204161 [Fusarium oxysporum]